MTSQIKILSLVLIACFATIFTSCKDDDSDSVITGPLVGKWKWTINERLDCGQDEGSFDVYDCNEFCYEIELLANGRSIMVIRDENGEHRAEGTYVYAENSLKVCAIEDGTESCNEGEITIFGDSFKWFIPKESDDVCDVIRHFEKIK